MDHTEFLKRVRSYIKVPTKEVEEQLDGFSKICSYVSGQYDQDESFIALNKHVEELEKGQETQNRIFYMALPPSVFITVSEHLKKNCYPRNGIARIIVRGYHLETSSLFAIADQGLLAYRLRSPSERTSRALESCKRPWSPTGRRRRSSVSTTTSERRW